jgi:hypothetical protein
MKDYLGIGIQKLLEEVYESLPKNPSNDQINSLNLKIDRIIEQGWVNTKNPTFKLWQLLREGKEDEAIICRKNNVMARDTKLGLYFCHKQNLPKAFELLTKFPISSLEKKELLESCLSLGCITADQKFLEKVIKVNPELLELNKNTLLQTATQYNNLDIVKFLCAQGADPSSHKNKALKTALEKEFPELIEYLIPSCKLEFLDYNYLETNICQWAKTKAFLLLLKSESHPHGKIYLEGNNNQLLRTLIKACESLKPKSFKKDIEEILMHYPIENLKKLTSDQKIGKLATTEMNRRKAESVSKIIQKNFRKDLDIDI